MVKVLVDFFGHDIGDVVLCMNIGQCEASFDKAFSGVVVVHNNVLGALMVARIFHEIDARLIVAVLLDLCSLAEFADHSDPKSSHLSGTVPHGTAKQHRNASARNRKTVDSRFRTEPQNCGRMVPHGTAKLTQNCGLTVPYGTAKLWTHRSARNRKTVDSRFRTERQNCGVPTPVTACLQERGGYPEPAQSQNACDAGHRTLWRRGVTLNRAGHSTLATPVTARLRGRGDTLNRGGDSTLARTAGYPQQGR
ncbi:hypothetical protein DFH27DRAFT_616772 [Peziza echinospora]|nr:hypothetical protein DFH27DRAFT_616772 [Peziza echinospora]